MRAALAARLGASVKSTGSPVVFENSFAAISATNSFSTSANPSGSVDLSPYAAKSHLALVVTIGFFSNGGGALTTTCKYNSVDLTPIPGAVQDRSAGNNAGVQLFYMLNPPTTGALTLAVTATGTSNTGRATWVVADVYSNVGSVDSGINSLGLASGASLSVPAGTNQYAVNGMSVASTTGLASYSQTVRQGPSNVGGIARFLCGDAAGDASGTKAFSSTGASYNSAAARLLPAA
ncbi:uncharacterized protein RMCC_5889 [Mycolicibacterium canariasense]|uniref:Uncharacterized protein n=1 Tax=Mycolicibacterium canariasense TaxID=228230 RepID=A0A100WI28_MYCCR|nr:hypothetical protein [Mycolicibacterium canariasense]MCV7210516.1 hypothetical protein [Mycolicibacterium canariasense]GAS98924.1 uncharacterized protein RMCC_5889 [Mycolicibacterium canariasense]